MDAIQKHIEATRKAREECRWGIIFAVQEGEDLWGAFITAWRKRCLEFGKAEAELGLTL